MQCNSFLEYAQSNKKKICSENIVEQYEFTMNIYTNYTKHQCFRTHNNITIMNSSLCWFWFYLSSIDAIQANEFAIQNKSVRNHEPTENPCQTKITDNNWILSQLENVYPIHLNEAGYLVTNFWHGSELCHINDN